MLTKILTYKELHLISFPIYKLPKDYKIIGNKIITQTNRIIDDKNLEGDSMGVRRLSIPAKELASIKAIIFTYTDLLRIVPKIHKFIDSKGNIYIYRRTKRALIKAHRVLQVQTKDTYSKVILEHINTPFIVSVPPPLHKDVAQVVYLNESPWLILDFTLRNDKFRSFILI